MKFTNKLLMKTTFPITLFVVLFSISFFQNALAQTEKKEKQHGEKTFDLNEITIEERKNVIRTERLA
jgi:hypothetical protein